MVQGPFASPMLRIAESIRSVLYSSFYEAVKKSQNLGKTATHAFHFKVLDNDSDYMAQIKK